MIEVGNAQSIGNRENQEDYFASLEIGSGILSIVSDGMGGYEGGEIASQITVKSFIEFFKRHFSTRDIATLLIDSTHYANSKIAEEKEKNPSLKEMGSTLVAVYLIEKTLQWVSIGDSLLYRYSSSTLIRLNEDHSMAGEYQKRVDSGEMTQKEANIKPDRHALSSAMTGYDIPHLEQSYIEIEDGDRFILASDGIHTIQDKQIAHSISKIQQNQTLADSLIELVEKKALKNQDNTTVIILQVNSISNNQNIKNSAKEEKPSKVWILIVIIILLIGVILFLIFQDKLFEKDMIDSNLTKVVTVENDITESNSTLVDINSIIIIDSNATEDKNISQATVKSLES